MKSGHKINIFEKGSAIFIVLVGVVLFAALSFVVSQMLRSGNPAAISQEKARLHAQEILTYARGPREAVQSTRIAAGCADTDISFENSVLAGYTHAPAVDDACKIFSTNGAGMTYVPPPEDWLDHTQSGEALYGKMYVAGNICVPEIGSGDTDACASDGIDNEELILFVPYIRREVCVQLNDLAGIAAPSEETGDGWAATATKFTGTYADEVSLDQPRLMNGCFEGSGGDTPPDGTYHFFQVLLGR